jgi:hypothetical protein
MRRTSLPAIADKRPVANFFVGEDERFELGQVISRYQKRQHNGSEAGSPHRSQIRPRFRLVEPCRCIKPEAEIRRLCTHERIDPVLHCSDRNSRRILGPQGLLSAAVVEFEIVVRQTKSSP